MKIAINFCRLMFAVLLFGMVACTYGRAQGYQVGVVPPDPIPMIPPGDDIILYIHGGPGSKLEEASDLVAPLQAAGLSKGVRYTIISFDQPSQGYSSMVEPTKLVPLPSNSQPGYNPLVGFSENFVVAFVNQLVPQANHRNIYVIGGSTGGALTLRLGRSGRSDKPWLKKIVAWNPASVWTTFNTDFLKQIATRNGFGKSTDTETNGSRKDYIDNVFGPLGGASASVLDIQPNPEEWYRGDRDHYKSTKDDSDRSTPRGEWPCKWKYIGAARLEQQEIYNEASRKWHWRLGTEMLTFSFFNDSWVGPANTGADDATSRNYENISTPTLLVASDDDDWNEGYIPPDKVVSAVRVLLSLGLDPISATLLSGQASYLHIFFRWEDRWTQTRLMASKMQNTPGYYLWIPNTGHSIHNERPSFFATQIVNFLSSTSPTPMPLQVWPTTPSDLPQDEPCDNTQPPANKLPPPTWSLLDAPSEDFAQKSAKFLMEPAQLGGSFSDSFSPGTYGLRLRPDLRQVAAARDPMNALAMAALAFYDKDSVSGNAFADLAVTGRDAYNVFRSNPPTAADVAAAASSKISPVGGPQLTQFNQCLNNNCQDLQGPKGPPSQGEVNQCHHLNYARCLKEYPQAFLPKVNDQLMSAAAQSAINRAYQVAWALRRPDLPASYKLRGTLGWIAVSGEDDAPARPVNVPSGIPIWTSDGKTQVASYPQYDLTVTMCPYVNVNHEFIPPYEPFPCQPGSWGSVPITVRYTIASPGPPPKPPLTINPTGTVSPGLVGTPIQTPQLIQAPVLEVSVCLTQDGKTCVAQNTPMPPSGQAHVAIVSVLSAGRPVKGAAVSVTGQNSGSLTNSSGVAIVKYDGCFSSTRSSQGLPIATPTPCQGTATMSGYRSVAIALP
jgi:pimeloyl-ACP methyl ester carboxylesterase